MSSVNPALHFSNPAQIQRQLPKNPPQSRQLVDMMYDWRTCTHIANGRLCHSAVCRPDMQQIVLHHPSIGPKIARPTVVVPHNSSTPPPPPHRPMLCTITCSIVGKGSHVRHIHTVHHYMQHRWKRKPRETHPHHTISHDATAHLNLCPTSPSLDVPQPGNFLHSFFLSNNTDFNARALVAINIIYRRIC